MTQVIIYTNDHGNVSVCIPTNDLPIEEVLAKDAPHGAIIVDAEILPHEDDDFFNAWRLTNNTMSVDLAVARSIQLQRFNASAITEAATRAMNVSTGIENALTDAEFLAELATKRAAIAAATSTAELRAVTL
jgi:hypothetical protein